MFGMNRYKILKCFIKEKRNCRRAFLSGDRSNWFRHEAAHFLENDIAHCSPDFLFQC